MSMYQHGIINHRFPYITIPAVCVTPIRNSTGLFIFLLSLKHTYRCLVFKHQILAALPTIDGKIVFIHYHFTVPYQMFLEHFFEHYEERCIVSHIFTSIFQAGVTAVTKQWSFGISLDSNSCLDFLDVVGYSKLLTEI